MTLVPRTALLVAAFAATATAQNTQGLPTIGQKDPKREARVQYHAAQAVLCSAIAHAEALKALSEEPGGIMTDVGLTHVKEIKRSISECRTSLTKMGQAEASVVKKEPMKALGAELDKSFKAADEAHKAIDGHGKLPSPCADTAAHLHSASEALLKLADDVGAKPIAMPGPARKE